MPSLYTLNPLEAVWLAATIWCLVLTGRNWGASWTEYEWWVASRSEDRDVGVQLGSDVLIDTLLIAVQLLFALIGAIAAFLPDRPDVVYRDLAAVNAWVAPIAICLAQAALAGVSWVRNRTRRVHRTWDARRDRRVGDPPAPEPTDAPTGAIGV